MDEVKVNCYLCKREINIDDANPAILKATGERVLLCDEHTTAVETCGDLSGLRLVKRNRNENI